MRRKWTIILLIWIIALFGCATMRSVGPGKTVTLAENEAVIFGQVIFIENNREKIPYSAWTGKPHLRLFRIEDKKYIEWGFDQIYEKDGSFYWIVPSGTYVIPDIRYDYTISLGMLFQAPPGVDAFYLGTLKIDLETTQIIARRYVKTLNSITVVDEFDKAKEAFLVRNPDFKGRIGKNLMTHDPSIRVY